MAPEITYGRSAEWRVITSLGLELDDAGHVRHDDSGEYVPTHCGKDSVRIDNVAGFVHDESETNNTAIVCDTPRCILNNTVDV